LLGVDPGISSALPRQDDDKAQLLSDLHALNLWELRPEEPLPLETWLVNAEALATPRKEAQVFSTALAELHGNGPDGSGPRPPDEAAPSGWHANVAPLAVLVVVLVGPGFGTYDTRPSAVMRAFVYRDIKPENAFIAGSDSWPGTPMCAFVHRDTKPENVFVAGAVVATLDPSDRTTSALWARARGRATRSSFAATTVRPALRTISARVRASRRLRRIGHATTSSATSASRGFDVVVSQVERSTVEAEISG
jgi:hypothetical protein